MKQALLITILSIALFACKKDNNNPKSINGTWYLNEFKIIYYDSSSKKLHEKIADRASDIKEIELENDSIMLSASHSVSTNSHSFESTMGQNEYTLPVKLLSFTGRATQNNVLLSWSTATEANNSHFSVQRSLDGLGFYEIATVYAAQPYSSTINHYTATDLDPSFGTNYYRLKQVDMDGQFVYLNVRAVYISSLTLPLLKDSGQLFIRSSSFAPFYQVEIRKPNSSEIVLYSRKDNVLYNQNDEQKQAAYAELYMSFKPQTK